MLFWIIVAFLAGIYCTGVFVSFFVLLFLVMLGGRGEFLWLPFVYSAAWPILVILWLFGVDIPHL